MSNRTGSELVDDPSATVRNGRTRGWAMTLIVIVALVAVIVAAVGVLQRKHAQADLRTYTDATAAPTVSVIAPKRETNANEIVLPGNMQAHTVAPIYARTTGYVKSWSHDIGSRVRKGDLLAVIETPELDQQLAQSKADLLSAQSNSALAKVTADRYQGLLKQNAVSQQDTDNAVAQLQARQAAVTSAEANVKRLEQMVSFERVTAPFDGVVTARNLDIGQLVGTGGSTSTAGTGNVVANKPMFEISDVRSLRVYINVPQVNSPDAKTGAPATLTLPQYPGKTFKGTLVRTSDAVDPGSRTLLAEVEVDNRAGELLPGSYTEVHLKVSNGAPAWTVPVSAAVLSANGTMHVAVVGADERAHLVTVVPGRDTGATLEILSGLDANQKVISNPPDSLTDGQQVRVQENTPSRAPAPAPARQESE